MAVITSTRAEPGDRRPGPLRRATLIAIVVLMVLLFVGITRIIGDHGLDHSSDDHTVRIAGHGADAATVDVIGGTNSLTITGDDLGGDVAVARTPSGSRVVPEMHADDAQHIRVSTHVTARDDGNGSVALSIRLSRDVAWTIRTDGGTQLLRIDLTDTRLTALDVTQGVSTVDLSLPHPKDLLDVHISGGASAVRLHLADGVPTRYTFAGGGGSATIGDMNRQGIPAGEVITPPAWTGTGNRVDVHLDAGIGSLIAGP